MKKSIQIDGLKEKVNPIYWDVLFKAKSRVVICYGGSSSGKSYSMGQFVILTTLKGDNWLITRKVANTIRKSIFNQITETISDMHLDEYFTINRSEMVITCKLNSRQIIFFGCDDIEKLKSVKPEFGVISKIWMEEATENSEADYRQLTKRLRGVDVYNRKKRIYMTFNPIYQTHWIYQSFFKNYWTGENQYIDNGKVFILKTTYKDNSFLTKEDIESLEDETDKYYYEVYTLGNWGSVGDRIYTDYEVSDFDVSSFEYYINALDWGYDPDPFAFIRMAKDEKRKILYICQEIYETGLTNKDTAPIVKNIVGYEQVVCDCAEPKSIEDYKSYKINAVPCIKGSGSLEGGINKVKEYHIIVHPSCVNFLNEIMLYQNKQRRDGSTVARPVDRDNHLMDAMRYGVTYENSFYIGFV